MKSSPYYLLLPLIAFCVGEPQETPSPAEPNSSDISPDATETPSSSPSSAIDANLFEAMKIVIPDFNPNEWARGTTFGQDDNGYGEEESIEERDEMNILENLRSSISARNTDGRLPKPGEESLLEELVKSLSERDVGVNIAKRDQNDVLEELLTYISTREENENINRRDNENFLEELLTYLSTRDTDGRFDKRTERSNLEERKLYLAERLKAGNIAGHISKGSDRKPPHDHAAPTRQAQKRGESESDRRKPAKRDLARLNSLKQKAGYNALPPCAKICAARCISKQIHAAGMQSHFCVVSPAQCMCKNVDMGYCLIDCGTLHCKATNISAIYALLNWGANFCDPNNFM